MPPPAPPMPGHTPALASEVPTRATYLAAAGGWHAAAGRYGQGTPAQVEALGYATFYAILALSVPA